MVWFRSSKCGCGGMADTPDLGSGTERCASSSLVTRTIKNTWILKKQNKKAELHGDIRSV